MGKKEKIRKAAKVHYEEEENEEPKSKPTNSVVITIDSSDDEEANEDLSLKIVEKAIRRSSTYGQPANGAVPLLDPIDLSISPSEEAEALTSDVKRTKRNRKEKKKKNNEMENPEETVAAAKEELEADTTTTVEADRFAETNSAERSDNIVLRKLLRGPRYFDPPDSGWGTCYNCGEEGHTSVNCTSAKRKKPCFFCGSLEHNAKQCIKGQDCFICKKGGHRAKDCPDKYKKGSHNLKICLKCGETGHDLFLCNNDYSPDDLKEVQCYICKSFGHICCADFTDSHPRELSCYRCGQLGHSGLECKRLHGETTSVESPGLCFSCGEAGHFKRECTNKAGKRNLKPSTPSRKKSQEKATPSTKKSKEKAASSMKKSKEKGDHARVRSAPSDIVKTRKRKKDQLQDGGFTTPSKSKRRGGWITENSRDGPHGKGKVRGWGSPMTPTNKTKNGYYTPVGGGHASTSYYNPVAGGPVSTYYNTPVGGVHASNYYYPVAGGHASTDYNPAAGGHASTYYSSVGGASASNGSSKFYQHRYSASRFGDNSSGWKRRNYDW
ncbi:hypothetical protein NMG60_11033501 [Bertholletia excelsa]